MFFWVSLHLLVFLYLKQLCLNLCILENRVVSLGIFLTGILSVPVDVCCALSTAVLFRGHQSVGD